MTLEQQEAALEGILDLCRQPGFVHDIFANCDCRCVERGSSSGGPSCNLTIHAWGPLTLCMHMHEIWRMVVSDVFCNVDPHSNGSIPWMF